MCYLCSLLYLQLSLFLTDLEEHHPAVPTSALCVVDACRECSSSRTLWGV